ARGSPHDRPQRPGGEPGGGEALRRRRLREAGRPPPRPRQGGRLMPVAILHRFQLEVCLGRDGDIEEWLATDTSLVRPVLIRVLGPETAAERRRAFVDAVQKASAV